MKQTLLFFAPLFILFNLNGCASSGIYLEPPTERIAQSSIQEDIESCRAEALKDSTLSSADIASLKGKETDRLFMNGRPVINSNGKPAFHQSLLPRIPSETADKYALCLLNKGYRWSED